MRIASVQSNPNGARSARSRRAWGTAVLAAFVVLARPAAAAPPGLAAIRLSPERLNAIGVKFVTVEERDLTDRLETTGTVEPDERLQSYVQLRVSGWIKSITANQTYAYVHKGEPLFTIYSPDLAAAEEDYLLARSEQRQVANSSVLDVENGASSMAAAALDRLARFGASRHEIARLQRERVAGDTTEIDSPATGYITERNALPNMYAEPQTRLFTITDFSRVWVYAAVFQDQIGRIKIGDPASVTIDAYPGKSFDGRVDFIWPTIDPATRTARVRLSLENSRGLLKPGMFLRVVLSRRLGRGLAIPESGVLRTGLHDIVFVNRGGGYLEPVEVQLGAHLDGRFQVLKGLHAGQEITASANFLIDSESQLQAALGTFAPAPPGASASGSSANSASIELTTAPNPPRRGTNLVQIAINDASGKPLDGADVSVIFFMPAMPAMQMAAMKARAKATEQSPGHYVATVELQSGGTWQVTAVASKGGREVATRELSVAATGPMM